jgi:hypothetical protein
MTPGTPRLDGLVWVSVAQLGTAPGSRGRLYASGDILAMVDVDPQDPPKELIRLTTQFDILRTNPRLCSVCSARIATFW